MNDLCTDNRFELIDRYKQKLIESTNIETAPDEMAVLDSILFRFWQMGWLDILEAQKRTPMNNDLISRTEAVEPYKVGHWVEVHGYATPGGDPVWACSECGKGIHVYGIEHGTYGADVSDGQWVSCPNCGTVMEENNG